MATTIQIRRDSAADWTSVNPTLSNGEFGYETDTDKLKIGDGTTAWNSLGYLIDGSSFTNIGLTDLSVGAEGTASGNGSFEYNNTTGVFTYTPPDLSTYLTSETSHADVLVDGDFATAGFMKTDGAGNYTVDNSTYLTSFTETNDLTAAVTWTTIPNEYITAESVAQHNTALSITESQISDLGSYLTDLTGSSVGTLSDVNFNSVTLDGANGAGKVLAWDQTLQAFVPVDQSGGGGLANVVEDTTPELGGNLDALGNNIVNVDTVSGETDQNIFVRSNGTGKLFLTGEVNMYDQYTFPNAQPSVGQVLVAGDFGALSWDNPEQIFDEPIVIPGVIETSTALTGATGTVVHDSSSSHIFTHSSIAANFTANFTNLSLSANQATAKTLVLTQGGTAYIPNAVQLGGAAQTILWQDGSVPSGTANGVDVVTFSILYNGTSYTVLGNLSSHS